ncbi:saccharopine dehydrogenase C-terminal domain-containing protein [Segetibacter koreensis]|uniref:saccharopine dehydrogenase C-terminal domain-containing protein n=1 Tax=Segetibacter koreensis TaxID=398037 RepID=UPI0003815C09|nr:saccharopine dehydrogenase C-terminal domain-containing protein [Segetibacter koreensis]
MKHILLFGAGKSATYLIEYLKEFSTTFQYNVTVADENFESVRSKVGEHPFVKAAEANAENETERKNLIQEADVVISLLPPSLHYLVAIDCINYRKHLLTASYTDEKILALKPQIESAKLLFLCEMGLDPGIDHMSAMKLINTIKALGGKIISFKSHCGGLVAPESDDNPWHYKISWNPRNIILAGKAGAVFKENGEIKHVPYEELFTNKNTVVVDKEIVLSYYPNRDSLAYVPIYNLENTNTFIRTTLRHPDFCFGWKNLIDLKLTDDTIEYNTNNMSIADFFKAHFDKFGFNEWLNEMLTTRLSNAKDIMENLVQLIETEKESQKAPENEEDETIMLVNENGELNTFEVEDVKEQAAASLAVKMHEASLILKQLFFLGLDSNEMINQGNCTAAEVLQFIVEKKLALKEKDKDMIVMVHEIEYERNGSRNKVRSSLIVKGEDGMHTAMAKTVGLPLGIAAKLVLDGSLTETGLHIPVLPSIYIPVLDELAKHGIEFTIKFE